ncbi:MAG: hypothetical protein WB711_19475 [Terriglobales bacterium]
MGSAVGLGKLPFKKAEVLDLKKDQRFNEKWLEKLVWDDPEILGLGKVKRLDRQKRHKDGILDVVLESEDKSTIFVVELMLGPPDASHIVRTMDYWLREKNANARDVEYRAILIGEKIVDSRFVEVAKFLTSRIPELVVMEVAGLRVGNKVTLHFTTILRSEDLEPLVSEERTLPFDREAWLGKSKKTVEVAEAVIKILQKFDPSISPNFRQHFIGILVGNRPVLNFVSFGPFRGQVKFRIKVEDPAPWRDKLKKAGLQVLQTDRTDNKVRMAVTKNDLSKHERMLTQLCKDGYEFWAK